MKTKDIVAMGLIAGIALVPLLDPIPGNEFLTAAIIAIGGIVLIDQSGGSLSLGDYKLVA